MTYEKDVAWDGRVKICDRCLMVFAKMILA